MCSLRLPALVSALLFWFNPFKTERPDKHCRVIVAENETERHLAENKLITNLVRMTLLATDSKTVGSILYFLPRSFCAVPTPTVIQIFKCIIHKLQCDLNAFTWLLIIDNYFPSVEFFLWMPQLASQNRPGNTKKTLQTMPLILVF